MMGHPYDPSWGTKIKEQIDQTPGEIREKAVQDALQEAGVALGLRWEHYLSRLHALYLTRLEKEDQVKERWAWLNVILAREPSEGQTQVLQVLIEVMARDLGLKWRDWKSELHTSFSPSYLEDHIRLTLINSILSDRDMVSVVPILHRVQEAIEQRRGLTPGTLMKDIATLHEQAAKTLHLQVRVKRFDVQGLCDHVEFLLGKGRLLLILEERGQPDDERTIYYQQRFSAMPYDQERYEEMTEERLAGILDHLGRDSRTLAIQHTTNASECFPPLQA